MSKSKKILFVAAILLPLLTLTACSKVSLTNTGSNGAPIGEAGGPGGDGGMPPEGTPPTDGGGPGGQAPDGAGAPAGPAQ